jgi:signal transduction histidine kinase
MAAAITPVVPIIVGLVIIGAIIDERFGVVTRELAAIDSMAARNFLNTTVDGMIEIHKGGKVLSMNYAAQKMFKTALPENGETSIFDLLPMPPKSTKSYLDYFKDSGDCSGARIMH